MHVLAWARSLPSFNNKAFQRYTRPFSNLKFSKDPETLRRLRMWQAQQIETRKQKVHSIALYIASAVVLVLGGGYALTPLYTLFCQKTGFGGVVADSQSSNYLDPSRMVPVTTNDKIQVHFIANPMNKMPWTFVPLQDYVLVKPGETALAFFKATNPTNQEVSGLATYNIIPAQATPYFIKIQCFCFEEQKLLPGESVDMPVFFYVDPAILTDAACQGLEDIALAYTFFQSKL